MFATCSDDTTVALWDLRYLKMKVRSLQGHSNWVKNIEYSHKDALLVTSGFDGSIFTWDINSHTEQGLIYQKVFHTSGLMRCRITPDGSKLVICTTGGYLMIIHDLDLTSLHKDLCGFRVCTSIIYEPLSIILCPISVLKNRHIKRLLLVYVIWRAESDLISSVFF